MPDTFEDVATLEFVEKLVNGKYPVKVPKFLDHHQWWGNWETARFNSMEELLKPGMVLLDVGAFDGWQDVILSRFVGGGQNMVLIEPVAENWANIKATWEANGVEVPRATYMGLISPETWTVRKPGPILHKSEWPEGPHYSQAISVTKFKHIAEHLESTSATSLKYFAYLSGIPDAINIDVEGAELLVLESGFNLLREFSPLIWVSIHPEFMKARYNTDDAAVHEFMAECGYKGTFLGTDHEQHWIFRKDA
jgi:FkbM family methyltransferase